MTLKELNKLKCSRGWFLSDRELIALYYDTLEKSGFTMVANKHNYVCQFLAVCKELDKKVEAYIKPYKSVSLFRVSSNYSFVYFFDSGHENEVKDKLSISLGIRQIDIDRL